MSGNEDITQAVTKLGPDALSVRRARVEGLAQRIGKWISAACCQITKFMMHALHTCLMCHGKDDQLWPRCNVPMVVSPVQGCHEERGTRHLSVSTV